MAYDIILGRDEIAKERFGIRGTIFLGKSYVQMGSAVSLSNRILLDVASTHVILISGKRGSGKSHSLGVIAEEMAKLPEEVSGNLSMIMLDTMGIFWTMKYPNLRDEKLLDAWNLKPEGMNVNVCIPSGYFNEYKKKGLPVDTKFSIKTSELDAADWCAIFDLKITDPIGVLVENTVERLRESEESFDIDSIINAIKKNKDTSREIKDATINRFLNAARWGLFKIDGTPTKELIRRGEITILDLSAYSRMGNGWNIKNLVVGIIARKLLAERVWSRKFEELDSITTGEMLFSDTTKKLEKPLIWMFIDEAHQFLAKQRKTAATEPLIQLLREGRQPGISLVLATQQPGEIAKDVLTQSDIVISHRLTSKTDIDALNLIMQSYLLADIQTYMNTLPDQKGSAIVLDDNSERIHPMRVRPKLSWHGGESPSAIKHDKKEEIEKILGFEL